MSAQLVTVPNFLAARSPLGLRRLMLLNNTKKGTWYKYFDIQFNQKDGRWYAWYFEHVTDQGFIDELERQTIIDKKEGAE